MKLIMHETIQHGNMGNVNNNISYRTWKRTPFIIQSNVLLKSRKLPSNSESQQRLRITIRNDRQINIHVSKMHIN